MKKNRDVIQPAWDLFCQGNLAAAEQEVKASMQQLNNMGARPVPDVMILKAYYLCRLERYEDARKLFSRILEFSPDDHYAQQGYLLSLNDELRNNSPALNQVKDKKRTKKQLILGIGTGRSGSTTLTKLLQMQVTTYCSHEHPPRLSWGINSNRIKFQLDRFDVLLNHYHNVADVSHWWLPYIDFLVEKNNDIRIVVMKRNRKATVDSFLKIKGGGGRGSINHWIKHDGSFWSENIWDECYPKYKVSKMKKSLEHYWDDYYKKAYQLMKRYPESIKIFSTDELSNPDVQKDMLLFCGYEEPVIITDLYLNKGGAHEGERMY